MGMSYSNKQEFLDQATNLLKMMVDKADGVVTIAIANTNKIPKMQELPGVTLHLDQGGRA